MEASASKHNLTPVPSLPGSFLAGGVEIRIDLRLASLAAALTVPSSPGLSEHPLVTSTRESFQQFRSHASVQWLSKQVEQVWLLGLAMRTVQLGNPPTFVPCSPQDIPHFVQRDFAEPPLEEISYHLATFWQDVDLSSLFKSQVPLWEGVIQDAGEVLLRVDIVAFEQQFFGRYPFHLVIVPLANLAPSWVNGVGVANQKETYAVCCLKSARPYQSDPLRILDLAQHEASHPVLEDVLQLYPHVPDACAFIEKAYPPSGRFAQVYEDHNSRWAEIIIRASTWFFLQELGKTDEARTHVQGQREQGVAAIDAYIAALKPWWHERRAGKAPGLDGVLGELPSWLHNRRSLGS